MSSFHGRPLPRDCVGFSSDEGKRRFAEALTAGDCEAFFPLSEQFITQDEPTFCGISSLCMVLNALRVDPGPTRPAWREDGVWRWFDERVLCLSAPVMLANGKTRLSQIKTVGVTLDEFTSLAEHNGARVQEYRPEDSSEAQFRAQLIRASRVHAAPHIVVAFSRRTLMQTGDGHFSPVAGYHAETDSVLMLDVARFK
jgi:glutathione gamma-glutamylcysteinyltransferase